MNPISSSLFSSPSFLCSSATEKPEKPQDLRSRYDILAEDLPADALLKIDRLIEGSLGDIQTLGAVLKEKNLAHPLLRRENVEHFPFLALAGVKENVISDEVFADLMVYWSVLKYHPREEIESINLFDQSLNINPIGEKYLTSTFESDKQGLYSTTLNRHELAHFYRELSLKSPWQQQFWLVEGIEKEIQGEYKDSLAVNNKMSVMQAVWRQFKLFSLVKEPVVSNTKQRMIVPISIVQAYCNAKSKGGNHSHPVQINPILGLGRRKHLIKDGLTGSRLVTLPFPLEKYCDFQRADGFTVKTDYNMIGHDYYHVISLSHVPLLHRKLMIRLVESIDSCLKTVKNPDIEHILKKYCITLLDKECSSYRSKISREKAFWKEIMTIPETVIDGLTTQRLNRERTSSRRDLTDKQIDRLSHQAAGAAIDQLQKVHNSAVFKEIAETFIEKIKVEYGDRINDLFDVPATCRGDLEITKFCSDKMHQTLKNSVPNVILEMTVEPPCNFKLVAISVAAVAAMAIFYSFPLPIINY